MKKDKIQEVYESMIVENFLNERKIEVEATLESIDDYLHFFSQAMKAGTLKGDMEWGKNKLEELIKTINKIIKKI